MREKLGKAVHDLWRKWAKQIMKEEKLSPERKKRWKSCMIEYEELEEEQKELDRKIADEFIKIVREKLEKEIEHDITCFVQRWL